MRVKLEVELEVTTEWHEIDGCTEENFKEHVKEILENIFTTDMAGDLDFVGITNKVEFM